MGSWRTKELKIFFKKRCPIHNSTKYWQKSRDMNIWIIKPLLAKSFLLCIALFAIFAFSKNKGNTKKEPHRHPTSILLNYNNIKCLINFKYKVLLLKRTRIAISNKMKRGYETIVSNKDISPHFKKYVKLKGFHIKFIEIKLYFLEIKKFFFDKNYKPRVIYSRHTYE